MLSLFLSFSLVLISSLCARISMQDSVSWKFSRTFLIRRDKTRLHNSAGEFLAAEFCPEIRANTFTLPRSYFERGKIRKVAVFIEKMRIIYKKNHRGNNQNFIKYIILPVLYNNRFRVSTLTYCQGSRESHFRISQKEFHTSGKYLKVIFIVFRE